MRIYYSDIKRVSEKSTYIAIPILLAFSNFFIWGIVDNIGLRSFLMLMGIGAPAAISAVLSLYLFKDTQKKYWYAYSVFCEFFVQLVIFIPAALLIEWGSAEVWLTVGTVLHLPTFYVDGLAIRKLYVFLARWPNRLLRRFNIHLIPDDVEQEVVFKYEKSDQNTDLITGVENKIGKLNDRIQMIGSLLRNNTNEVQQDANNLISDLYHLKKEYVSVKHRLQRQRIQLKKLEHLKNLTEDQVDSLLSRMSKGKAIDWIIGFILGFIASLLVQMLSSKIPVF